MQGQSHRLGFHVEWKKVVQDLECIRENGRAVMCQAESIRSKV